MIRLYFKVKQEWNEAKGIPMYIVKVDYLNVFQFIRFWIKNNSNCKRFRWFPRA